MLYKGMGLEYSKKYENCTNLCGKGEM